MNQGRSHGSTMFNTEHLQDLSDSLAEPGAQSLKAETEVQFAVHSVSQDNLFSQSSEHISRLSGFFGFQCFDWILHHFSTEGLIPKRGSEGKPDCIAALGVPESFLVFRVAVQRWAVDMLRFTTIVGLFLAALAGLIGPELDAI